MSTDEFSWEDKTVVAVPQQDAIAVYANVDDQVVIRFHDSAENEDRFVYIDPRHIGALCKALRQAARLAKASADD